MKKRTWLTVFLAVIALFIIFIGAKANAWTQFRSGNSATVSSSETVDSSLWVGGRNIDIAGTVNGDVFCVGQTVNISGTIKGDIICAAQTINISGSVDGDVRLAGATLNLTGSIARNASMAGQTINIDSNSRIGGDASVAGNDMNLNGNIGRDLAIAGTTVNLNGQVGRDIKGSAKEITLGKDAKVGGGIDYTSKEKINLSSNKQVAGTITQHQPKARQGHIPSLLFFGWFTIFIVIMLLISALIATALLPQLIYRVSEQGRKRPWVSLLTGFVASIVVPIVAIILMLSVVALPLGILLFLAWMLVNLSSGLFSAFLLGRWVWRGQRNAMMIILVGALILLALYIIPVVGIITLVLASWMGEGMIIREIYSRTHTPKYQIS